VFIEFVENEKFPKKNAATADTPESFKDAGYILKENDLVIDVDALEKSVIKRIIEMFNIKTQIVWTPRGAHFYFKKPQGFNERMKQKNCPLGFMVEYKHHKNSKYITVKQGGELRIFENEGVREDLPDIFYCNKRLDSLLGIEDGEGRNNALFAHRMKIHHLKQWKSILRFINNNILAEPLPEEEFKVIARDAVKTAATRNNQPEIADYLISKYKTVLFNGKLYYYDSREYITDIDLLRRLVFEEVGNMKTAYVDEVIKQMQYRAPRVENKVFDIKLQNGILRQGQFIEVEYNEFTPYSIDIPYLDEVEPVAIVDDYLNQLTNGDLDYKLRLLETLAHPLVVDRDFKRSLAKFFIFIGSGGNGKGTLLQIIKEILGKKNCSALSIKQMADERYFNTMHGKLVNLGDDIEDEYINKEQIKLLKNISTCDYVNTRQLFENAKEVELSISLIFTSNHLLKAREKGESYRRRVDWCPMFTKPNRKDPDFIKKLTTPAALQYWVHLIVKAYMRLYRQGGFTPCKVIDDFNEDYHNFNDNFNDFLDGTTAEHWIGKGKNEIYREYKQWCEDADEMPQNKNRLFVLLMEKFRLEHQKVTLGAGKGRTTSTIFVKKQEK
jgi:putative DNA primase/helicase